MRIASVRDHADEDADFGVVSDNTLHVNDDADTPTTVPGARTIRTADLVALLAERNPVVLDVGGSGKSIRRSVARLRCTAPDVTGA
jgi:hypothetical protein